MTTQRSPVEAFKDSRALLESIFENSHVLIALLDQDMNFVRVNKLYADIEGKPPTYFIGKNHFDLYPHAENEALFKKVLATGETYTVHERPFEFPGHPERGVTYWDWTLQPIHDVEGQVEGLLLFLRDVTDRKRREEQVRIAYEALETSVNGVAMIDADSFITYANPSFSEMFHFASPDEALGVSIEELLPDRTPGSFQRLVDVLSAHPHETTEVKALQQDGHLFAAEFALSPVTDSRGVQLGYMAFFLDISRRKLREEQNQRYLSRLRSLASRLVTVEEEGRRKVASFLHDAVIQNLSLSNIKLGKLRSSLRKAEQPDELKQIDIVRELLDEAIKQCRLAMTDLTPPLLYEVGLAAALRDFAGKMQAKHEAPITVVCDDDDLPEVLPHLKSPLFESTRELVINALKHAGPCEITICLFTQSGDLAISVTDTGQGFDPAILKQTSDRRSGGFGLFYIAQRIEELGGRVRVESNGDGGTNIVLTIPNEETEDDR